MNLKQHNLVINNENPKNRQYSMVTLYMIGRGYFRNSKGVVNTQ